MMLNLVTARSPVFNAMFEHEMEESKKVTIVQGLVINLCKNRIADCIF